MINLLPPEEKNILKNEERCRLIMILGFLVLFFLISFSLILFSVKIYITGKAEAQKTLLQLEEESFHLSEIQKIETETNSTNQKLERLEAFYENRIDLSELFAKISETLPAQTYLENFSLNRLAEKENKFRVSLGGHCATREILFEFKQKLESEPLFEDVDFPPQNWIKSKDIDFTVTFETNL